MVAEGYHFRLQVARGCALFIWRYLLRAESLCSLAMLISGSYAWGVRVKCATIVGVRECVDMLYLLAICSLAVLIFLFAWTHHSLMAESSCSMTRMTELESLSRANEVITSFSQV